MQIEQNHLDSNYSISVHINELRNKLTEKEEELHDMDNLNQTLILREHMSNNELQAARKELINVLPQVSDSMTVIGLKRMGEVVQKPFQDVCMQKFSAHEWEFRSVELSSLWQDKVNNPNWHPFKQAIKDGKVQIIDAIRRILYASEEDPSIVEEAQAMLLNQEKQLNPISEDAEECKFEMAFFQLLSN